MNKISFDSSRSLNGLGARLPVPKPIFSSVCQRPFSQKHCISRLQLVIDYLASDSRVCTTSSYCLQTSYAENLFLILVEYIHSFSDRKENIFVCFLKISFITLQFSFHFFFIRPYFSGIQEWLDGYRLIQFYTSLFPTFCFRLCIVPQLLRLNFVNFSEQLILFLRKCCVPSDSNELSDL